MDRPLDLLAHSNIGIHYWRRMGDADINQVPDLSLLCRLEAGKPRDQVHFAKLPGLCRTRLGNSYKLDKGVGRRHRIRKRRCVQSVPENSLTSLWELALGTRANQETDLVSASQKYWKQMAAKVTSATGDEDTVPPDASLH